MQSPLGFPPAALPAISGTIRPSDCLCFLCLPPLVVRHTVITGSPQLMQYSCVTWLTLAPAMLHISSPFRLICMFPSAMSTASAHQFHYISGLKCLMTLLPRCLRLAHSVIVAFPRLASGGWLDLPGRGFHPLCTTPFAGRTLL